MNHKDKRLVKVAEIVSSRYSNRPQNFDERLPGLDIVKDEGGEVINLYSDGGQSAPKPGWTILINGNINKENAGNPQYTWTLYGMSK